MTKNISCGTLFLYLKLLLNLKNYIMKTKWSILSIIVLCFVAWIYFFRSSIKELDDVYIVNDSTITRFYLAEDVIFIPVYPGSYVATVLHEEVCSSLGIPLIPMKIDHKTAHYIPGVYVKNKHNNEVKAIPEIIMIRDNEIFIFSGSSGKMIAKQLTASDVLNLPERVRRDLGDLESGIYVARAEIL